MSNALDNLVERCIARVGRHVVLGLPLGLGKPNRLVNAFCARARAESDLQLDIVTALSLDVPPTAKGLEGRMAGPITERLFGQDYPRLDYLAGGPSPDNIRLTEFYFQSGAALGDSQAQRHYVSSNYTHVARDLLDRGINVVAQLIAADPGDSSHYSLSCNPDVTLDVISRVRARPDYDCMVIGHVHPDLPFMHGDAVVPADFFDEIVDEAPQQRLFAVPRGQVSVQDHWVGLNASALLADGGTLQIGIGSLSDALVHGLILRQHDNARYRRLLAESAAGAVDRIGGVSPMKQGLYGASEMFMEGFMHLYKAGILKREVFDDLDLQQRINDGETPQQAGQGVLMDGGFFLGSAPFYDWLRNLDAAERPRFRMHGVGRINQLYGGSEALEIAQRRRARFVNTCMMMTLTGAAVSDGLKDYQVVSGVGGQYNFVAMAHAMDDGRSVLMLRSVRERNGEAVSNIVWQYPHITIPRHLRDLVVTEYGVADLRGRTDEECIQAMLCITDSRFQEKLRRTAAAAGKLDSAWRIPDAARYNTPDALGSRLEAHRDAFPDFPFGTELTAEERQLLPALKKLERASKSKLQLARALLQGRPDRHRELLARLDLAHPGGFKEKAYARLVAWALDNSRTLTTATVSESV